MDAQSLPSKRFTLILSSLTSTPSLRRCERCSGDDGDGDLGDYDADTLSLWITDTRFPLTEKFHIPPLAPQGSSISIEGDLHVTLEHIILESTTSMSEDATFTIKLKDRAGNWSNEVTSGTVTILP